MRRQAENASRSEGSEARRSKRGGAGRSLAIVIATLCALLVAGASSALAADGDLDPSFADFGTISFDLGGTELVTEVLVDPAGVHYLVGRTGRNLFVYSLQADGTPNLAYGDSGLVVVKSNASTSTPGGLGQPAAALDSQGRVIAAAVRIDDVGPFRSDNSVWVARLDPSGQLDMSFGDDGVFTFDAGSGGSVGNVLIEDPERFYIVGSAAKNDTRARPFVATVSITPTNLVARVAYADAPLVGTTVGAIGDQGLVLATGEESIDGEGLLVFRPAADLSADPAFEPTRLRLDDGITPAELAVGPAGRIVVAGHSTLLPEEGFAQLTPFVARILPDGGLDRALQGRGWARTGIELGTASGLAVDQDHRIVVAVHAVSKPEGPAVLRLRRTGTLDPSFGTAGIVPVEANKGGIEAVAAHSAGLVVAGGHVVTPPWADLFAARLEYSPVPDRSFVDDDGSVFESDIEALAKAGVTLGCNPPVNDRFCPDDPVTRGQMAAFLVRGLGYNDDGGGDLFVDDDDSVFATDIDKLGTAGVTLGCNPPLNDRFCSDDPVTRGQMAAFLVRALGYSDDGGGDLFTDDDDSVFEADIDKLGTAGVTLGCNPPVNDRFCPDGAVTRGQMAAFLSRALDLNLNR